MNQHKISCTEIVAVIPAAGTAARLAPLPFSKELIPIGFDASGQDSALRIKVVSQCLLQMLNQAGIKKAYIVLHPKKLDIPAYFGSGQMVDMNLAYLFVDLSIAVPYTLDRAYPFVQHKMVALGFPDVILRPEDSFEKLLAKQMQTRADIVLGLYPTEQPHKMDLVDLNENGRIQRIRPKPVTKNGEKVNYAWLAAIWTPIFTRYLHEFVSEHQTKYLDGGFKTTEKNKPELFLGEVFQAAIEDRLNIETVIFPDGKCLDIGTPEDLAKVLGKDSMGWQ